MSIRVITQPATEPVTSDDCKTAARLSTDELDRLIEDVYIPAARRICEQRTGRSLTTQTLKLTLDDWPREIALQYGPVQSAVVKYMDTNGVEQTLSTSVYELELDNDFGHAEIVPKKNQSWPSTYGSEDCISVTYVAGYGEDQDVPAELRAWIVTAVSEMIRSGSADVAVGFCDGLLDRARVF